MEGSKASAKDFRLNVGATQSNDQWEEHVRSQRALFSSIRADFLSLKSLMEEMSQQQKAFSETTQQLSDSLRKCAQLTSRRDKPLPTGLTTPATSFPVQLASSVEISMNPQAKSVLVLPISSELELIQEVSGNSTLPIEGLSDTDDNIALISGVRVNNFVIDPGGIDHVAEVDFEIYDTVISENDDFRVKMFFDDSEFVDPFLYFDDDDSMSLSDHFRIQMFVDENSELIDDSASVRPCDFDPVVSDISVSMISENLGANCCGSSKDRLGIFLFDPGGLETDIGNDGYVMIHQKRVEPAELISPINSSGIKSVGANNAGIMDMKEVHIDLPVILVASVMAVVHLVRSSENSTASGNHNADSSVGNLGKTQLNLFTFEKISYECWYHMNTADFSRGKIQLRFFVFDPGGLLCVEHIKMDGEIYGWISTAEDGNNHGEIRLGTIRAQSGDLMQVLSVCKETVGDCCEGEVVMLANDFSCDRGMGKSDIEFTSQNIQLSLFVFDPGGLMESCILFHCQREGFNTFNYHVRFQICYYNFQSANSLMTPHSRKFHDLAHSARTRLKCTLSYPCWSEMKELQLTVAHSPDTGLIYRRTQRYRRVCVEILLFFLMSSMFQHAFLEKRAYQQNSSEESVIQMQDDDDEQIVY